MHTYMPCLASCWVDDVSDKVTQQAKLCTTVYPYYVRAGFSQVRMQTYPRGAVAFWR
jgi:hypothetical protein